MTNIGWNRYSQEIVRPVKAEELKTPERMEHYEALKIDPDASEGQKEFARRYNAMRKKLIENGLMEKK